MERMSPDSQLPLHQPSSEAPDIELVQAERAIDPDTRDTLMLDLGKLTLNELVRLNTGILGPSLQRVAENVDDEAVAGFSQGLA